MSSFYRAISPSMICMDLCNLERDVHRLENMGCGMLHVDLLDGRFSPSMPVGLDVIKQLRKKTDMIFDAHVMTVQNDFFVNELLDIGVERLCFQLETQPTPGPLLHTIRNKGCKAGLALAPSTPVSSLEYLIENCDYVLLMQIDPGYASFSGVGREPFMMRKIADLQEMINKFNPGAEIEVDGRVGFQCMPELIKAGVNIFVSGTKGIFSPENTWENNWNRLQAMIS